MYVSDIPTVSGHMGSCSGCLTAAVYSGYANEKMSGTLERACFNDIQQRLAS